MLPIVAIVGRPNVGKSTLFNRIIGRREAVTLDTPGVTRDRHYGRADWEGKYFLCVDTGGLNLDLKEGIEDKINEQANLALQEAQIVIFVMNGREGLMHEERDIARKLKQSGKNVLYVINKIDGPDHEDKLHEFYELGVPLESISSEHGYKVNDLLDKVVKDFERPTEEVKDENDRLIKIALIGRPNVGKSSLLNHLVGQARSIVHNAPGTTRDVVDTEISVNDKSYLLLDTAGIRRGALSASKVERFSVLSSIKAIERSDVCLLLLDASEGIHKQDAHVAGYAETARKTVIILWNKWDLITDKKLKKKFLEDAADQLKFLSYAPISFISAKTGQGCHEIWSMVNNVYATSTKRISTSKVNDTFTYLTENHNPPVCKGSL
ncbi:MAG: ribosome biogenesis GTPase Der [Deltaproteobacteria bacterium]|nr:MAG: ribosome biogenesis GTPase Der [Deltaproteobacteria bacterium]